MKKLLFIITIFLMSVLPVMAKEDLVIKDLKIKNANISPKFDKYNNYYSVTITEDIKELELEYEYDEEKYEIEVVGNENLVKNKLIYVSIYDKESKEQNTYIFKTFMEKTETTINIVDNKEVPKTKNKKTKNYAPVIGTTCFILIILCYYLIFLR